MKIQFTEQALKNLNHWKNNDKKVIKKILILIEDIKKNPYSGLGKPEILKHELKGHYSRRITQEHRLIYKIEDNRIIINSCRFLY